jgi:predicted deacylase
LPQIRANLSNPATFDMANAFGAPVVIDSNVRDGSLRACAADHGMPMLIYEAGEALRFDNLSIRAGIRGIINVMRHIDMLPAAKSVRSVTPVLARATRWVRAPDSGIVKASVVLGGRVAKHQVLATISDPLGRGKQEVLSPFDGIVIGQNNLPLAHEGDALFNLAAFENVPTAENLVEEFAAQHTEKS